MFPFINQTKRMKKCYFPTKKNVYRLFFMQITAFFRTFAPNSSPVFHQVEKAPISGMKAA